MDITAISSTVSSAGSGAGTDISLQLPTSEQWSADRQDALSFSNALEINNVEINSGNAFQGGADSIVNKASTSGESSLADEVIGKMQSLSSSAEQKGEELQRLIVKATDTLNPADVISANRMMSEYYLENLMTAKLIGNATKAIERLTSLQ